MDVREFYGKVWEEYADPVHHPITAGCLRKQRELVRARINDRKPRSILDLGCGPRPVLRPDQAPLVVSADLIREMLSLIADRYGCRPVCLDARCLPFRARSFDFIWCGLLVDHIRDVEQWIADLVRVLRPGGTLGLAGWDRSGVPPDRYPGGSCMRYTRSTGEELVVDSYANWEETLRVLRRRARVEVEFHAIDAGYTLLAAFARPQTSAKVKGKG
ncbi:MAG: class I SAM-dependent methyltransferase [bacterium]